MTPSSTLDPVQQAQEAQYNLPYHYIPSLQPGRFSQHLYWDWGFRYLGGLRLVTDILKRSEFSSLVDIGCGDGRFLREIHQNFSGKRLKGFDYSDRAIALAKALNPRLDFECLDIFSCQPAEPFDVATLVEVIEHIEPSRLPDFLEAVQRWLKPRHFLLITVPHVNKPLIAKHYQHFDSAKLRALLAPHYRDLELVPFDAPLSRAPVLRFFGALLGGRGKWFVITQRNCLRLFYNWYLQRCLYARNERECERIAVICRK